MIPMEITMDAAVMRKKTSELTHIWVDITSKCNNRCGYCYDMGNTNQDVSLQELQKIFNLIQELSVPNVILIGGEPTLHKDFLEIVRIASRVSNPSVITNGTRFADKKFCQSVCEAGVGGVMFSLTSPIESHHDAITSRQGSYRELLCGIKNLLEYLPASKIRTSTTITNSNLAELNQVIDLDISLGIRRSVFNVCVPSICDPHGSACVDFHVLAKIIEDLYRYAREKEQSIKIATNLPFCIFSGEIREELREKAVIFTEPCQLYRGSGYEFLSDGSIIPCTHLHDCVLGNPIKARMTGEEFMSFINSDSFIRFRRNIWRYPSEKCRQCSEWEHCVGGCPLLWNVMNPDEVLRPIP